jgi:hypothetical protein
LSYLRNRIATVTVKGLDVVIDNYCFPTSFVLFGGIFLVRFSIRNTGLKRLFSSLFIRFDRLEGSLDTYHTIVFGADTIPLIFWCLNHDTLCQYKKIER